MKSYDRSSPLVSDVYPGGTLRPSLFGNPSSYLPSGSPPLSTVSVPGAVQGAAGDAELGLMHDLALLRFYASRGGRSAHAQVIIIRA